MINKLDRLLAFLDQKHRGCSIWRYSLPSAKSKTSLPTRIIAATSEKMKLAFRTHQVPKAHNVRNAWQAARAPGVSRVAREHASTPRTSSERPAERVVHRASGKECPRTHTALIRASAPGLFTWGTNDSTRRSFERLPTYHCLQEVLNVS